MCLFVQVLLGIGGFFFLVMTAMAIVMVAVAYAEKMKNKETSLEDIIF